MNKLKMMLAMMGMMLGAPFGIRMKSCQQVAELLSDYIDGEVGGALKRSIDLHVMACPDCQNYLDSFATTRDLVGEVRYREIPAEFREHLHGLLADRLRDA